MYDVQDDICMMFRMTVLNHPKKPIDMPFGCKIGIVTLIMHFQL